MGLTASPLLPFFGHAPFKKFRYSWQCEEGTCSLLQLAEQGAGHVYVPDSGADLLPPFEGLKGILDVHIHNNEHVQLEHWWYDCLPQLLM